jgi:hypothetical protein
MKNHFLRRVWLPSLLFSALLLSISRPASANTPQAIGNKITGFYKWYVGELKKDKVPMDNKATIRHYSSRRLWNYFHSKAYEDFNADYFTSAQDFGDDWNVARASNVRIHGRTATMVVTLGTPKKNERDMGQRTLQLKLVKEAGAWKIDRVNGE